MKPSGSHVRVANRPWVAVVIPFLNGRDRPPEDVMLLTVPGGDYSIRERQIGQGEEPGTISNPADMRIGDGPETSVPKSKNCSDQKLARSVCSGLRALLTGLPAP